jgi:hypothetical protein
MAKIKKRYTVFCEQNIRNLQDVVVVQRFVYYFASDSLGMAQSIAASLKKINHAYRIMDGTAVVEEWIRKGFQCA